ncbi:DUF4178 domain-containing protein [Desmonostoc muscorum LEGE 12446]|uniref:DUF4178 domain-containing protein n=1 Tax=Desmonostoc muscorum LEGE 12446 TaxID=1828758 RepID=A0A8J6ZIH8_DESMC|nr:DUF4178 domain-containing protein [Desmonostoc muscorum]MCF2145162.1 DUF4178 domain-containing protein [Desmonostoc muscorum LEGE 12446]
MATIVTQTLLEELRPGDRLTYHGVDWDIEDYSTYQDSKGYQTDEWLLTSKGGSEYYLLREFDPDNAQYDVTWYLANPVQNCRIFLPDSQENILPRLWQEMQSLANPYPELLLFHKPYYFESQTQGSYEAEEETTSRITWDYWDQDHHINLAIEAFPDGKLDIYSTQIVQPQEFSKIQKNVELKQQSITSLIAKTIQFIIAFIILFVGLFLMIFG